MKSNGKSIISKLAEPLIFVTVGALLRLVPHPANFAPIAAMALFGGVYLNRKQALILPILAMIVSDLFLGFGSLPIRLSVYGSFILTVLIGFLVKNRKSPKNIIFGSLSASVLFFLVTNFAVWAFSGMYPGTLFGLSESYFLAIPFFRNTILGDLFYTGVFFGGYELALRLINKNRLLHVRA